jgi:predicted permease
MEGEMDCELRFHIERFAEDLVRNGIPVEEAKRRAQVEFGATEARKEECREALGLRLLDEFRGDFRYAFRMLRKAPGFATVAILSLAIGIGANTALFSIVNGVLLNPLPYPDPDRLVVLYTRTADGSPSTTSYPNFLDWAHANHSFAAVAIYRPDSFSVTGTAESERVPAEMVSAGFFPLLGVQPVLGRTFLPAEDQLGASPVVMIGSGLWKRRFGSSSDILGKPVMLNGTAYSIIGVVPAGFHYYARNFQPADIYFPIGQCNVSGFRDRRITNGTDVVGRLKPGISFDQAEADMRALGQHLADQYPDADSGKGITLVPLKRDIVGPIEPLLMTLLGAVAFVLLIACVNVANLLLARSTVRTREIVIRSTLGASRNRVIRQLLIESILLALMGGALGCLIAFGGMKAGLSLLPEVLPRIEEVRIDQRVLLVMAVVSVIAGILFGLVPAIRISHRDLHKPLKEGGRGSSGLRHRTQSIFVVAEMALALVLLMGAGLMIRSLAVIWRIDPGFDYHHVLTAHVSFPSSLSTPAAIRAMWRQIDGQLRGVPGLKAASLSVGASPMGDDNAIPFWLEGQPKPRSQMEMNWSLTYFVQPDYLEVMKIPLKRGRFLTLQDNERSPLVTVIDDQFARRYFGDRNPIGKRVNVDILNWTAQIVGVVGHVKQWGLDENPASSLQAQCYFSAFQIPDTFIPMLGGDAGISFRTEGTPLGQVSAIRHALSKLNSELVMYRPMAMDEIVSGSLAQRRFSMILLGVFAALALILSCVGIYGVTSYVAGQRTHEIGIRVALGAGRRHVFRMVLRDGAKMTATGIAIGLVVSFALARLIANMLFGIGVYDPFTLIGVVVLLGSVALTASCLPARRASRIDPMVALKYE